MRVFLDEKAFEGAHQTVVTDDMKVLIAAHACLLLLHRDTDYYPRLRSIIIYPDAFVAPRRTRHAGWVESEYQEVLAGESWGHGVVVLSWADVVASAARGDGHNVTLHEFAHQLDEEDGVANGAPVFGTDTDPVSWAHVMRDAYEQLRHAATEGNATLLDPYGAESPAEFFAVATETFFERGRELRETHSRLYDELRRYYRQDPGVE